MSRLAGALVFASCVSLLIWFWAVPAFLSQSTFAAVAVFLIGGTAVVFTTWRNAQATSSMAQLLHDTEDSVDEQRHV